MSSFILSCCSTADMSKEFFIERNIPLVCFHFTIDDVEYTDDLGESISYPQFYKKISEGAMPTTSQANVAQYIDFFEPFLKDGKDILHIDFSSGLSGSYTSCQIAKDELLEKYPNRQFLVADSLCASSGYGLLMTAAADLRDEGKTIDEVYDFVISKRLFTHHWFFSTDLTSYYRGGRISKTSQVFGTMLNICPLLSIDNFGKLIPREKYRGKRKVLEAIVLKMEQHAENGLDYSGKCYISHSDCYDDALELSEMVKGKFKHIDGDIIINSIGTVIGSHTGPGTVALFFFGDERKD
ncbi:MAG: DegV family protein [Oscillospiraceae bacterium]